MSNYMPSGTITAIVTPFTNSGNIDFNTLKKLIDFQIENGVDGIVVCGSTGESPTLTLKEKQAIIIRAVEYSAGRIPIIAGTGTNETQLTLDLSIAAKSHGANALLIVAPYYNKPTQNGLYEHFRLISENVDLPIIMYNIPSRTGVNMLPETQLKLAADCKNIIAVKEASGNLEQMMTIIKYSPKNFNVLSGDDMLTLPLIACGGKGVISTISNYLPKEFSQMVKFALEGNIQMAAEIHYKIFDLLKLTFIETNPIPVKAAMNMLGLIKGIYRMPMTPMQNENKKKLKIAMQKFGLLK